MAKWSGFTIRPSRPAPPINYANGLAVDLNSLLVNPPPGLTFNGVTQITNTGRILAWSQLAGNFSGTHLLTSVSSLTSNTPEPRRGGIRRRR